MSLLAWYPFNGNMNNNGLVPCTITGTPSYSNDGKLGQCLSSSGIHTLTVPGLSGSRVWSVCFWEYIISSSVTSNWTRSIQMTDGGSNLRIECCPKTYSDGSFACRLYNNDANKIISYNGIGVGNRYDQWLHCCVTSDGSIISMYIDGSLVGTSAYNGSGTLTGNITIENNSKIKKNDFRLYDHCLSAKEVKEISKGLFIHYPLNNQYEQGGLLNKYSGNTSAGYPNSTGFTVTKLENERGYNYKMTYTSSASRTWKNIEFPEFSFTVGKRYYYSIKVRANKASNCGLTLRAARVGNDWVTNMKGIDFTNYIGVWREYFVSQIMPESFIRRDETITEMHPRLEFYTSDLVGEGVVHELDFDIKDVQIVESDSYIPYIENELMSNTVCDTSGYEYNAIASGDIMIKSDSPRYNTSSTFNGTNAYITAPAMTLNMSNITFSFWCKWSEFKSYSRIFDFSQNTSKTERNGFSLVCCNKGTSGTLLIDGSNAENEIFFPVTTSNISLNTWYHVVITISDTTGKVYINNELVATVQTLATGNVSSNYNYIGKSNYPHDSLFKGNISDFRIYATALSAEDVKELYSQSVFIDNKGNIGCYEFVES